MAPVGRVFDVSRGCVDDGPGLRTVVFLKGCRLGCPWCHNPEGISFAPEIAHDPARCIACGACREACPRDWPLEPPDAWRRGCRVTARCTAVCPARARRLVGRDYEVADLVAEVADEAGFLAGTGGGVTFSGGEPLAQPEFLFACAAALRALGLHVAVETAGFWPRRLALQLDAVDLVLFDLKHVEPRTFRAVIGKSNRTILDNLEHLLAATVPLELRLTLVPAFNDRDADLVAIARWLRRRRRAPRLTLLPFHRLAAAKQARLGRAYAYASAGPLPPHRLAEAAERLRREGVEAAAEG